jgi:hypothetical protein
MKCNEIREIFGGKVVQNHGARDEACLNQNIFKNCGKGKTMGDFCERPRKLIHKELLNQDLDTLSYKDIRNISRNVQKARSSKVLHLPTDM